MGKIISNGIEYTGGGGSGGDISELTSKLSYKGTYTGNIDDLHGEEHCGGYWCSSGTVTGTVPFNSQYYYLEIPIESTGCLQRAIQYNTGEVKERFYTNNQWYSWTSTKLNKSGWSGAHPVVTTSSGDITTYDNVNTTELGYLKGVTSAIQTQLDGKQASITGGATTITSSNLTASRALVSNSSGKVAVSAVTSTELGYLDGVTSAIQTQLDGKASKSGWTASRVMCSNSSGNLTPCNTTTTEIGYVSGVTSAIQTQLNGKAPTSHASTATTYGVGTTSKYGHCMTINNLTTSSHANGKALSAYQGKLLNDKITKLNNAVNTSIATGAKAIMSYTDTDNTYYDVDFIMSFTDSNNAVMSGDKGVYVWGISSFSDERLKINIKDSQVNALEKINQVQLKEFDFIDEKYGTHKDIGYIAQELKEVFPETVVLLPQDKEKTGYDSLYQVEDKHIIPYLVKSIQELSAKVDDLEVKIDELKNVTIN